MHMLGAKKSIKIKFYQDFDPKNLIWVFRSAHKWPAEIKLGMETLI